MTPDSSPPSVSRRDFLGSAAIGVGALGLMSSASPASADDGASVVIVRAATIITMDKAKPRAEAVAFNTDTGRIVAVGTFESCHAAFPAAKVQDLGHKVLMPGLIQAHDHPIPAAVLCQLPAYWIAPFMGFPTFGHVEALFRKVQREVPMGQPVMFNGLDRLLLQCPMPNRASLDRFFPDRPAVVFDITGHAVYFNTLATALFGWKNATPPPDVPDARWGRDRNGQSDGTGVETSAFGIALTAFAPKTVTHPLLNLAAWYATLAGNGFTAAGDMAFMNALRPLMEDLASRQGCPIRYSGYQPTYDKTAHEATDFGAKTPMLRKAGIKIWMDGSPSIATATISFPYLPSHQAEVADIPTGKAPGLSVLNHTPEEFAGLLDAFAGEGWQMAVHINGDAGLNVVLDGYEAALKKHGLLGTDHRWRLEHFATPTREQCLRAGQMGVTVSMSPFQALYWGDIYDGVLFEPKHGARWQPYRDAFDGGLRPSFHNDGYLSPPLPWLNIQNAVTRRSASGKVHDPAQAVSLDEALAAHTINAAWQQKREHEIGSIEVGKYADFAEISKDPYRVDPTRLQEEVKTLGTWVGGIKIDLEAFVADVRASDPTTHHDKVRRVRRHCC